MSGKLGLAAFAAAILLGSIPGQAQVRGMPARMAVPPARPVLLPDHAPTYVRPGPPVRIIRSPVRIMRSPVRVVRFQTAQPAVNAVSTAASTSPTMTLASPATTNFGGTPIPLWQVLNQAPGLGFDFNHLAAIDSNLAVRAIIDPLTRQELSLAEQLPTEQPAGFGWGYFPAYGETGYTAAPAQPQVIVVQEPVPQAAPAPQTASAPVKEQAPAPPVPPLPGPGDFLLVRHDGQVIHAVAFSQEGSRIVYITSAGLRRTVALDQLDLKATEERNAERGSILHFTD